MTKLYSILILILGFFVAELDLSAQRLAVNGQKIVNSANNQEVILNALNFGNWMVMEGYMMNSNNEAPSQHQWKQKLTNLIGAENTAAFYKSWLNNHVNKADIDQIKAWGFNSVRLPLHYEYFVNLGTPDVWNEQGFEILDNIFTWCKSAGIYAVIDLHAAPGGQSDNVISDYDNTKPSLWGSEANKTKTVKLWRKLSERYKNEDCVAGYDLINEPAWNIPNGTDLRKLYGRLTDTIRANGDNHILFIEGNWYSNDYTGLTPAWDDNMVYVFHKYWSNTTNADLKWVLDLRANQNRPIWCGEHGENSNTHFTKTVELFKANNIGMSWWPMKKFESLNDFADAKWPAGYQDLLNYLGGTNPNLSPATALATLNELTENLKLANCKMHDEVVRAIFVQTGNRNTEPYSENNIPGLVYAPNYDKGLNGYAYSDQAWEDFHITTNNYTAWNQGWSYRNDGVDIEACTDASSNGYNVGWFNQGEWMKYTCNVSKPGTYTVEFRIANGGGSAGTLQIQNADGTQVLASVSIPTTGGWKTWKTVSCSCSFNLAGLQAIRFSNTSGSFNLASANFIYLNSELINPTPVVPLVQVVSLKGSNSKYVTYSGSGSLMTSASASVGVMEQYTIVDAGNGASAFQGSDGMYVTLNASDGKLYCNSSTLGADQMFTLDNLCGVYSLKGPNNLYVSSENGASTGLTCNRTSPGGWEFFNWDVVSNPTKFVAITGIAFSKPSISVPVGGTQQLAVTFTPTDATNTNLLFQTSDASILSVSASGMVTALAAGTATVTATSQQGTKTTSCTVIVTPLTGLSSLESSNLVHLFPNPATNTVSIDSDKDQRFNLTIYSVSGKPMFCTILSKGNNQLSIGDFPDGVYFVHISGNDVHQIIKLVKSN